MYRILIVEDDLTIAGALASHLRKWDYEADYVEDFKNVMERFGTFDPQLVILDIGLPFFNGFYWCQQIRQVSQVPIIFLSSLDDNMSIVMAMNMGGDEFIALMYGVSTREIIERKAEELCARIRSIRMAHPRYSGVSVSIGVAIAPEHGDSFEELYAKADVALYHAKQGGRDRFVIYGGE